LPLDPGMDQSVEDLDGKMLGITTGDMAVAIADEAEQRTKCWKHWTMVGSVEPEVPVPTYARYP